MVSYAARNKAMLVTGIILGANIFLHLVLDTLVGKIRWFYPFSRHDVVLFNVTARYQWWVWNFILHWSFMLEGLLLLLAIAYWRLSRKSSLVYV